MAAAIAVVTGCSTQKNTSQSRWWHAFHARYNTYFNGSQAYIDGSLEKENGNKDNFTEMIPLYVVGNKSSKELGKANFDRAIEKSKKAIQCHSIKKRPEWNKNRKKTDKDKEWLSRREYNPFLWKAWMLMGRSQFHKGAFDEAASTFSYMSRLYHTQPAIYGKARAWLAKCYVEEGWLYDAEDVIRNMQRDSIHWRALKEWDYTYADYYIRSGEYAKAIPYLRKVIRHEMRRKQKAREWYLMGQLQAAVGNKNEAYKAFRHVVALNPPYELEFNARIAMTEVLAARSAKKMIGRLKRMAASDNNKEYLDQVYYAMGNIYLAQKDTVKAIEAYEKGNTKATRSGIEKGVLLLKLGDIYWELEKFSDARRCYGEAIGLLDKERKDYQQLSERSKVLDELVPYTDAVHLQDSLQILAKLPEKERNEAIDRVIAALRKKEKEERDRQAEAEVAQTQAQNAGNKNLPNNRNNTSSQKENSVFYFYNPMAVNQGKSTFEKQWGKRENADDWQRSNKTVVGKIGSGDIEDELTEEQRDSIEAAEQVADSLAQIADSAQNDPHKREYYLKQIPFEPDQLEASNKIIMDGLHHAGVIFKDKLDNLPLSEKFLTRLTDNYPDYENMDDVFYHLFLLFSRKGDTQRAETYIARLKENWQESNWTILLTDPHFVENSKFGVHIEDSLYAATYKAFKEDRYGEVAANTKISETRFPLGANRDKFLFIGGLGKLNNGDADGCLADMKTVVEKYPKSRISEMAGMIVNGVNAGRKLRGGKFTLDDIWSRRSAVLNDSDSINNAVFVAERLADFKFLLVYSPDSIDENKLLFNVAKFNFTKFLVRNFDMEIVDLDGIHQMQMSGFRSFDEASQYARELFSAIGPSGLLEKVKPIAISEKNLQLLGTNFSYKDYDDFYARNFAPLKVESRYLLSEPAEVATPRERDLKEEISSKSPTTEDLDAMESQEDNLLDIPEEIDIPESKDSIDAPATNDMEIQEEETEMPSGDVEMTVDDVIAPSGDVDVPSGDMEIPAETSDIPNGDVEIPAAPADETIDVTEPETIDIPTTEEPRLPETPAPSVQQKPAEKERPVEQPEPANQPEPDDEDVFIFDDEDTITMPKQPAVESGQPQNFDIEDEYYELDGF